MCISEDEAIAPKNLKKMGQPAWKRKWNQFWGTDFLIPGGRQTNDFVKSESFKAPFRIVQLN